MTILDDFKFFKTDNTNEYSNTCGNVRAESLELEVTGTASTISLQVETKIDAENGEWVARKGINYNDMTEASTITAKGQYSFHIGGVSQIRIHNTATTKGGLTVYGKLVGGE